MYMAFECNLNDWLEKNSIEWEYDPVKGVHTFTLKPLDPLEAALQECFGDTEFPKCEISSYVIASVKSLGGDITCLTALILSRLGREERHVE